MLIIAEDVFVEVFDVVVEVVQALNPSMLSAKDLRLQVTKILVCYDLVN